MNSSPFGEGTGCARSAAPRIIFRPNGMLGCFSASATPLRGCQQSQWADPKHFLFTGICGHSCWLLWQRLDRITWTWGILA